MNQEGYLWNGRSGSRSLPRLIKVWHAVGRQQQYEPVMGLAEHVLMYSGPFVSIGYADNTGET